MTSGMKVSPGGGRATPKTVPGKSSGSWIAQISWCGSGGLDLSRIAHGDPVERHDGLRRQGGFEMDDAMYSDLGAAAKPRAIEDSCPGYQEDVVGDGASG
jgi:hypothetical protein